MKNLKSLRSETGISQNKLAEAVDSTQQAIHRYEHEDYEPDINTMMRIANHFNTSIDYLVGNSDVRNKIEKIEKHDLNADETVLIEKYRSLTPKHRKSITVMLDTLLAKE